MVIFLKLTLLFQSILSLSEKSFTLVRPDKNPFFRFSPPFQGYGNIQSFLPFCSSQSFLKTPIGKFICKIHAKFRKVYLIIFQLVRNSKFGRLIHIFEF